MPSSFEKVKKDCLTKKDKSNKQSIDKDIKQLVNFLNAQKDYYTTSSCSGRILWLEKKTEKKKDTRFVFAEHGKIDKLIFPSLVKSSLRSDFINHKKADFKAIKNSLKKSGLRVPQRLEEGGGQEDSRTKTRNDIWFKQESIIIHVCCRNLESAKKLLKIVRDLGIKRAGIINIGKRIILEIIGTEAMETIIARDGKILVSDDYLRILVEEANKKLEKNKERIKELTRKFHNLLNL